MRRLCCAVVACILAVGAGLSTPVHGGQTTNDEVFASAALRNLHDLARAAAQYEQAIRDSDQVGCHDAHVSMQKVAHEALIDMHSMSFAPIDAIENVSILLRLSQLEQNDFATRSLVTVAGQAIMALRSDYSIGDRDWYTITPGGTIKGDNPLRYAQSLKDQGYSWVLALPTTDMGVITESGWKAEMASLEVDDSLIENSGTSLKTVEVDYRKDSNDHNMMVYFYRTKNDVQAAIQFKRQLAELNAREDAEYAELKASEAEWSKKLASLPYMIADHDAGFKLVYDVCRDAGKKTANGGGICADDGSHDWSDSRGAPYHRFSDMQSCEAAAQFNFGVKMNSDDALVSACVPAPKVSGHVVRGYQMVFALVAPGAAGDDALYAGLREQGSNAPVVFTTFKACYDAGDPARLKALTDLGADEDGNLLGDKAKSIDFTANCVRVY